MKLKNSLRIKKQYPLKAKTGLPPGTLVHIGEKLTESVTVDMVDYSADHFAAKENITLKELSPFLDNSDSKTWVRISGLHDAAAIESLGSKLGIHPLVLEDIMNTTQRPKIEAYDDYLYIVVKSLAMQSESRDPDLRQLSIILSPKYLITFHEHRDELFDTIPPRVNITAGRFRKHGVDYLLYSILDIVVDQYFTSIEKINDEIMDIENSILEEQSAMDYHRLHELRRDIIHMRGKVAPIEEVLQAIIRDDHPLITNQTRIYFRDVLDHTRRVIDNLNHSEQIAIGLFDLYMTRINIRTGEIMKVLTIIATIFIPLTFIVGIYGMNFDTDVSPFNMPELRWYLGYPAVMIFMLLASLGMLYYFRRKKWL